MNTLLGYSSRATLFAGAMVLALAFGPLKGVSAAAHSYEAASAAFRYNRAQPLAVRVSDSHVADHSRIVRLSYASANHQRVPALLFLPAGASAKHPVPAMVLLHGLGGIKELMSGMAFALNKQGIAALAIDEYHQGERAVPDQAPATLAGLERELVVGLPQTGIDVRRGVDYLQSRSDISHSRIGAAGISLGAMIGVLSCAVEPRLKTLVAISGGGDWSLIIQSFGTRHGRAIGMDPTVFANQDWAGAEQTLYAVDPVLFAPHLAPRRVLMINGSDDRIIPPAAVHKLQEAVLSNPKARLKSIVVHGAGHLPPPEQVYPAMQAWLRTAL